MRKSLIALAVAGFAIATTTVGAATPAQAKGKGFGVGLGVGLVVGGILASRHHHHHHHARPVAQPQPYPVAARPQAPVAPLIRTADDQGRFFDTASNTWFDGRNQCFRGTAAWTFKAGSWFYGTAAWTESNGVWRASTGAAPIAVECAAVPTIAARLSKQPVDRTAGVVIPSREDHAVAVQGGVQASLSGGGEAAEDGTASN